ncbi:hypothetical protein [Microbacterium sp. W4I20]|uniref:hypothetical protein n=1 Tax=Microbacterium sp. W4I20 TaxID=3042262 RepID=UPI002787C0A5|nr:hypothetical protein [Microbacterium sp. W4I20]MDQ0728451.1 hypothetical protein [Microbacterium sp. W4I20]
MLPPSPDPLPRVRAERMLIARIVIAVGLALLLVVGAWSTAHGKAHVHASLCLAAGVSHSGVSAGDQDHAGAAVDLPTPDTALCLVAILCVVALVLLYRMLRGRGMGERGRPRIVAIRLRRAGPASFFSALTLTQLSISRT